MYIVSDHSQLLKYSWSVTRMRIQVRSENDSRMYFLIVLGAAGRVV